MLFRFLETTRQYADLKDLPVSKSGNRFISIRVKQLKADGAMCPEITISLWGDMLCKEVFGLGFGDVIEIDGIVRDFSSITSITRKGGLKN